jgi:hypothetical protein
MSFHACSKKTVETCTAAGRCVDPGENVRLRKWLEKALGTPILEGLENFESCGDRAKNPTVVVEETF